MKTTTTRMNKPGGVLHVDLTRAHARIAHAMMLVEDTAELRELAAVYDQIDASIKRLFGNAERPRVNVTN
jgi:hypothetical protein